MERVLGDSNPFAARRPGPWRMVCLATMAICLGFSPASAETIQKKFATVSNPSFMLHSHSGDIALRGWEQNQIRIEGEQASKAVDVFITGEPGKVSVETHPTREGLSAEQTRVDLQIWVPRQASVHVNADQGALSVEQVHGDVTIEGVSNSVLLSDLRGHILVRTVEGPIRIRNSEGYIQLHSISGNLELVHVNGSELTASTNSGSIRYEGDFASGGTYVLKNYDSAIDIVTTDQASFDLTARAVQGLIENHLSFDPVPLGNAFRRLPSGKFLQGRFNTGKSTVRVTSYSGTIRVQGSRTQPEAFR